MSETSVHKELPKVTVWCRGRVTAQNDCGKGMGPCCLHFDDKAFFSEYKLSGSMRVAQSMKTVRCLITSHEGFFKMRGQKRVALPSWNPAPYLTFFLSTRSPPGLVCVGWPGMEKRTQEGEKAVFTDPKGKGKAKMLGNYKGRGPSPDEWLGTLPVRGELWGTSLPRQNMVCQLRKQSNELEEPKERGDYEMEMEYEEMGKGGKGNRMWEKGNGKEKRGKGKWEQGKDNATWQKGKASAYQDA